MSQEDHKVKASLGKVATFCIENLKIQKLGGGVGNITLW